MSNYVRGPGFHGRMKNLPGCLGLEREYKPTSNICVACPYRLSCSAAVLVKIERRKDLVDVNRKI